MNENKETLGKDVFFVYREHTNKLFNSIKKSVPYYHQSITNIQQESLHTCENFANNAIILQKEYFEKTGFVTTVPEIMLKVFYTATEEFVKASSMHNQIILTTIDATQQNIRTFNDNAKIFADLNKNIIQSWFCMFTKI